MIAGYYSSVSGMVYNQQRLDVVSNNLSNQDTPGFRRSFLVFNSRSSNPNHGRIDSGVRKRLPSSYGIQRAGVYKDYQKTGNLKRTDNSFDVSIAPELSNAFYAVKRAGELEGETFYTRNGKLGLGHLDPKDFNSPSVLYMSGHMVLGANGAPIEIDMSKGDISIDPNGVITQLDQPVGDLPLYRFNDSDDPNNQSAGNLQLLNQVGDSLYRIPEEQREAIFPFQIEVGVNGVRRLMAQRNREGSNVDITNSMMEMMSSTKSVSANSKALDSQVSTLSKFFQSVRSS